MLSDNFDLALNMANKLHREQTRKSTNIPYIAHLMAVSGIVLEANAYHPFDDIEDIAIAALLHDAIEDQGHQINFEQLRNLFGDKVHDIILDCTDFVTRDGSQKKLPWRERKEVYIKNLHSKSKETLLVITADKLHNARSIMFDYDRVGYEVWDRFNTSKEETIWYYESLWSALVEAWPQNPLLPDFEIVIRRITDAADGR